MKSRIALNILREEAEKNHLVCSVRLSDVIDAKFAEDRGECLLSKIREAYFLWLRKDFQREHKWDYSVLNEIVADRADKMTLVTASGNVPLETQAVYINV